MPAAREVALLVTVVLGAAGCSPRRAASPPAPAFVPPAAPAPVVAPAVVETVTVRDVELERRVARLELQLWERDALGEELQARLDEARDEVVRAMGKLQTLATRAEAGSAMAEADVALQQLRAGGAAAEATKATQLMQRSSAEFNKQNYGGALYLAEEAKKLATQGRRRLAAGERGAALPGEVAFAVPVALKAVARANVREGPGTANSVVFTAENGTPLTGLSYVGDWVRVSDDGGRLGWVIRSLLDRR